MTETSFWSTLFEAKYTPVRPGERVKLKLLDSRVHSTGVVILRYEPAK